METVTVQSESDSQLTVTHFSGYSVLRLQETVWNYFTINQIQDRIQRWNQAANSSRFRRPMEWGKKDGSYCIYLPALPEGYLPFSRLHDAPLDHSAKLKLLYHIIEALSVLHESQFYMGFLKAEWIYFHPITLEICMDIQPFPSAIPFVDQLQKTSLLNVYPPFSRWFTMPRLSDFFALGIFIYWMFTGELPEDPEQGDKRLPSEITSCYNRLIRSPETLVWIEDILNELPIYRETAFLEDQRIKTSGSCWLHPINALLSEPDVARLRGFLRQRGPRLFAIVSSEQASRIHVLTQYTAEVIENSLLVAVICRNLPFAVLQELIDRTVNFVNSYFPVFRHKTASLRQKLNRLLRKYLEGDNIIHSLSEWLYQLYSECEPAFRNLNVYYTFIQCEEFDEDSQRVLGHFWQIYRDKLPFLYGLFSGSSIPFLFRTGGMESVSIEETNPIQFHKVILSQLGKADASLAMELAEWLLSHQISYMNSRIVLEELANQGLLEVTADGWQKAEGFQLNVSLMDPQILLRKRIQQLAADELHILRTFVCLPVPIRAGSIIQANQMESTHLPFYLETLNRLKFLQVFHINNIFIPNGIRELAFEGLSEEEIQSYYSKTLKLYFNYRKDALTALIELAAAAGDLQSEYYLCIRFYRRVRTILSTQQKAFLIERICRLQQRLRRQYVSYWDRQLCQVYFNLNQFEKAQAIAQRIYERTDYAADRFSLQLLELFQGKLEVKPLQDQLIEFINKHSERLVDRVSAAYLLLRSRWFDPLSKERIDFLHSFYLREVNGRRRLLPTRLYSEMTLTYTILLFENFPDLETWALALLDQLYSILERTPHQDLLRKVYDSYIFQTNLRKSRMYAQLSIAASKRSGTYVGQQIGHLNAMEISLLQGDLAGYDYHRDQILSLGAIQRKDLLTGFHSLSVLKACEWEEWDSIQQAVEQLCAIDQTEISKSYFLAYISYAQYRKGEAVAPIDAPGVNEYKMFTKALYSVQQGSEESACELLKQSIEQNEYRLLAGWAYRELLHLQLELGLAAAEVWLDRFHAYIKNYGHDLFWPDYYALLARFSLSRGDVQAAMLHLLRASNGYETIGKKMKSAELSRQFHQLVQPDYLAEAEQLEASPQVQRLLEEREQYLRQSLDLQITIQLSEQVTESLELDSAVRRLTTALFQYFPVSHLSIHYQLNHIHQKVYYSPAGLIELDELVEYRMGRKRENQFEFTLYQHGNRTMILEADLRESEGHIKRHLSQFLSFIKPHMTNAIYYLDLMMDNLTGFYQKRYFMEKLAEEYEASRRHELDLSVLMLDIDNFRLVNEHGHQEGDRVLAEIAHLIRGVLRKSDLPGRYGGEEFLLILPKTDGQEALQIARQLREEIESEFCEGRPYQVTASIGVASLVLSQAGDVDDLVRKADDAEILAKKTGKNRVISAW